MWVFVAAALVFIMAGIVLAVPLFFQNLEPFLTPDSAGTAFSESDALLEAMSELELEYLGGKVNETDYDREKIRLQREYLEVRQG